MTKPNIGIRIPPSLLTELNNYVNKSGTSRTDVIVSAIAQYLGCDENVLLNQRVAQLEAKVEQLQLSINTIQLVGGKNE